MTYKVPDTIRFKSLSYLEKFPSNPKEFTKAVEKFVRMFGATFADEFVKIDSTGNRRQYTAEMYIIHPTELDKLVNDAYEAGKLNSMKEI